MLRHEFSIELDIDFGVCFPCLCSPTSFFSASPYTYRIKRLDEKGTSYEIIFKWRKLGITRYFPVKLQVTREPGKDRIRIIYKSLPDSKYEFYLELLVERLGPGRVRIHGKTYMKAGLMADLLGRKEYRLFIENLVRDGVFCLIERRAATA